LVEVRAGCCVTQQRQLLSIQTDAPVKLRLLPKEKVLLWLTAAQAPATDGPAGCLPALCLQCCRLKGLQRQARTPADLAEACGCCCNVSLLLHTQTCIHLFCAACCCGQIHCGPIGAAARQNQHIRPAARHLTHTLLLWPHLTAACLRQQCKRLWAAAWPRIC
jgi:hypothetical protein